MKLIRGFTLMETVLYVALFAVVGALMTGIAVNSLQVSERETANTEVVQQLNFVMGTVQKLVGDASLVEAVYETNGDIDPTNDPTVIDDGNKCDDTKTYCTLKLRFENDNLDPTWVIASSTGIYLVSGDADEAGDTWETEDDPTTDQLTTDAVLVDFLRFTKYELPGGHALARMSLSLTYNTDVEKFRITRSLTSAIGRVTAATFDDSLVPNTTGTYDLGASGLSWRNAIFSGDVRATNLYATNSVVMAEHSFLETSAETGYGKLYVDSNGDDLHFMDSSGVTTTISITTDTKCIWLANPTAADDLQSIWVTNGVKVGLVRMWCESNGTVNADLQVDDGTPEDVNGTDLVCDSTPADVDSLNGPDRSMDDGDRLDLAITSVSGSPTWFSMCWTYEYRP